MPEKNLSGSDVEEREMCERSGSICGTHAHFSSHVIRNSKNSLGMELLYHDQQERV